MPPITLKVLIKKYGEDEGTQRWNSLIEKRKKQNTLEGFIERHGEVDGKVKFEMYRQKIKKMGTFDRYVEKYGPIDGPIRYKEKNKKLSVSVEALKLSGHTDEEIVEIRKRHAQNSFKYLENLTPEQIATINKKKGYKQSIEHYINQGFDEITAKKMLAERQATSTLPRLIQKYGDDEGLRRYRDINSKKTKNWSAIGYSVSKKEKKLFSLLDESIFKGNHENIFYYGKRGPTFYDENRLLIPDIVDNRCKVVIEFFGDFWHMNPKYYTENEVNPVLKMTAQEIWLRDKKRIDFFTKKGYTVFVVWESDFENNTDNIILELIKFYENTISKTPQ
jgi:G:T-mismatch repair DNA endonuclease (very short patch repair protein)